MAFAIARNSRARGARDLLGQLAVEFGGVDHEAFVRAFGDLIDAVVGHEREAELAAFDLLEFSADGYGQSRRRRSGMSEVDQRADALAGGPP